MSFEKIKERYIKNYIRDDQLDRFAELGVITPEQAANLKMVKSGGGGITP